MGSSVVCSTPHLYSLLELQQFVTVSLETPATHWHCQGQDLLFISETPEECWVVPPLACKSVFSDGNLPPEYVLGEERFTTPPLSSQNSVAHCHLAAVALHYGEVASPLASCTVAAIAAPPSRVAVASAPPSSQTSDLSGSKNSEDAEVPIIHELLFVEDWDSEDTIPQVVSRLHTKG
jgi:hypothetical protein